MTLARNGNALAIDLLSSRPDPEALELCRTIARSDVSRPDPWSWARESADLAVPRLEAFDQGTWEVWVKKLILEAPWFDGHFTWALEVAQDRKPGWLQETLRSRLSREYKRPSCRPDPWQRRSAAFDWVLLALAECGGAIDADELAYLQRHGYACDPREWLIDALRLAPRMRPGRALERALQKAKLTLPEMIDLSVRGVGGGTAVAAQLTMDLSGIGWAYASIAKDHRTWVTTTRSFDYGLSGTGFHQPDQSAVAEALRIDLKSAIETALRRERGVAIEVRAFMNRDHEPEIEVRVYWAGRIRIVTVDGVMGVLKGAQDGGEYKLWDGR